ncbi:vitamin K epoxide reductase complex subunit 1 [Aplysia californica]|uniref:vitamin-K-epoxide reductase (warfarin-sensitive) n=1 Tax=Aplysia californica TaxID=6500 RepID=A0ABM0JST8_APLCA|nr:vitamin K epoxide reductase complex subunit 1 [Aplysia californica]
MAAPRGTNRQLSPALLRNCILVLCFIGLCISLFALYVEVIKEKNPDYVALCDVNSYMTCSRVLTSRYAKGFGLVEKIFSNTSIVNQPNTVFGLAFYTFQASLATRSSVPSALGLTVGSAFANVGSIYLGYILAFVLKDFCIVCVSTYVVNFLLLVASALKLKEAARAEIKEISKKKK